MKELPMRLTALILGATLVATASYAQSTKPAEPFKVGTFEIRKTPTVGLVLRDSLIVDVAAANSAVPGTKLTAPRDMIDLIERYESGLRSRFVEIVNSLAANNRLTSARPDYVHDVKAVRTLPPIMYPSKILNAAVNFYSHVNEAGTPEEQANARRQRREQRGVPYLFLKPGRGAVVGNGDNVVIPHGRDQIDWEVELGAVIGRTAKYVEARNAQDYVFGYTVSIDVSDRGGRPPGGFGQGSDWFVGKGHDTFAPMGPWIVPPEFYGDPMKRLHMQLSIDGKLVQEAKVEDMIHNVWELIEYASSIVTLHPGDVVNGGTTSGTSSGAFFAGTRSGYLKPGETMEAKIEGIGTLRNRTVAGPRPPAGSGSPVPPGN